MRVLAGGRLPSLLVISAFLVALSSLGAGATEAREEARTRAVTEMNSRIAGTQAAVARLPLRSGAMATLDSLLLEFPLSDRAASWERALRQYQRDHRRDRAIAGAESLIMASRVLTLYEGASPKWCAFFSRKTLDVRSALDSELELAEGLPVATRVRALADSMDQLVVSELDAVVFAGSPSVRQHAEVPWVYAWPEDVEYPVPGHVLHNMVKLIEKGPSGATRIEERGQPVRIVRAGRATEVQVWLPDGFDAREAYVEYQEYLASPQMWEDGFRLLRRLLDE